MCEFGGVCVCVWSKITLKSSQMVVLFIISLFLTLLLQGQGSLHLYNIARAPLYLL